MKRRDLVIPFNKSNVILNLNFEIGLLFCFEKKELPFGVHYFFSVKMWSSFSLNKLLNIGQHVSSFIQFNGASLSKLRNSL